MKSPSTLLKCLSLLNLLLPCALLAAQQTQPLPAPVTPGKAIQLAAEAAAHDKSQTGSIDILSDPLGVDFVPYLRDLLPIVRNNWYQAIPLNALTQKGKVAIEFAILKNGQLTGMKLFATSGSDPLDRAAWAGITASAPFQPLPTEFKGEHLVLRFRFFYNIGPGDVSETEKSSIPGDSITHAAVIQSVADAHRPKYPKKARKAKIDGIVRLDAEVGADGKVNGVKVFEGDPILAEASTTAIREWRFRPGQINGKPVEDRVRVRVEFRLDGEQVRAQVTWPEPGSTGPAQ
jgi:TonB family protein